MLSVRGMRHPASRLMRLMHTSSTPLRSRNRPSFVGGKQRSPDVVVVKRSAKSEERIENKESSGFARKDRPGTARSSGHGLRSAAGSKHATNAQLQHALRQAQHPPSFLRRPAIPTNAEVMARVRARSPALSKLDQGIAAGAKQTSDAASSKAPSESSTASSRSWWKDLPIVRLFTGGSDADAAASTSATPQQKSVYADSVPVVAPPQQLVGSAPSSHVSSRRPQYFAAKRLVPVDRRVPAARSASAGASDAADEPEDTRSFSEQYGSGLSEGSSSGRTALDKRTLEARGSVHSRGFQQTVVLPPGDQNVPVPQLSSELRSVVFNPGTNPIRHFDTYFQRIEQPDRVRLDSLTPFVTSSRDQLLMSLAREHKCRLAGSTSSTTSVLSQFHFLLAGHRPANLSMFSREFIHMGKEYTPAAVKPACVIFRNRGGGAWGVDSFPEAGPKSNQILIDLGKSMEKMLTMEPADFVSRLVKTDPTLNPAADSDAATTAAAQLKPASQAESKGDAKPSAGSAAVAEPSQSADTAAAAEAALECELAREPNIFLKVHGLMLRSQLDCCEPGMEDEKKVFDLKTRATLPIRIDVGNHSKYTAYRLLKEKGKYHSFEREWYDMARSAFLKYSMQARIGQMGGVLVAFHNTLEIFGFEYIPLASMDAILSQTSVNAERLFQLSLMLYDKVVEKILDQERYRDQPCVQLMLQARRTGSMSFNRSMVLYVETLPPLEHDPERLKPFHERYCSLMRIDTLSDEEVRSELAKMHLSIEGSRPEIASRLESAVSFDPMRGEFPSNETLVYLVEKGYLRQYELTLSITQNGQPAIGRLELSSKDDIELSYTFEEVHRNAAELALDYRTAWEKQKCYSDTDYRSQVATQIPLTEEEADTRERHFERVSAWAERESDLAPEPPSRGDSKTVPLAFKPSEVRDSETQQRLGQSLKHRVESYMTNISQPAAADAKAPAAESKAPSEAPRPAAVVTDAATVQVADAIVQLLAAQNVNGIRDEVLGIAWQLLRQPEARADSANALTAAVMDLLSSKGLAQAKDEQLRGAVFGAAFAACSPSASAGSAAASLGDRASSAGSESRAGVRLARPEHSFVGRMQIKEREAVPPGNDDLLGALSFRNVTDSASAVASPADESAAPVVAVPAADPDASSPSAAAAAFRPRFAIRAAARGFVRRPPQRVRGGGGGGAGRRSSA